MRHKPVEPNAVRPFHQHDIIGSQNAVGRFNSGGGIGNTFNAHLLAQGVSERLDLAPDQNCVPDICSDDIRGKGDVKFILAAAYRVDRSGKA